MNKLVFALGVAVVFATGCAGMSGQHGPGGPDEMQKQSGHRGMDGMMSRMDANSDGMISKEEFMKAHEAMFDQMKGSNGMISLRDMQMRRQRMMEQPQRMGQDRPMPSMGQGTK